MQTYPNGYSNLTGACRGSCGGVQLLVADYALVFVPITVGREPQALHVRCRLLTPKGEKFVCVIVTGFLHRFGPLDNVRGQIEG